MEAKTTAPSFTVSLRGYDRMEVDEYLDSLAEALGQVEVAEDRNRVMQSQVDRLNSRIADLEERISRDVPRTGAVLGERIAILLRSAEETAADTIGRSEATSAGMIERAREEVASAEDQARGAIARGEDQARRIEAGARAEAAEIVAEAESRASARTRQIEQWAEQVISHTRAEEARMLAEQQAKRERSEAELQALAEQRDAVAGTIAGLRESLGQALGLVDSDHSPTALGTSEPAALTPAPGPDDPSTVGGEGTGTVTDLDAAFDPDDESGSSFEGEDASDQTRINGAVITVTEGGTDDSHHVAPAEAADLDADADTTQDTRAAAGEIYVDDEDDGNDTEDELPWPSAFRPVDTADDETADDDVTGEIAVLSDDSPVGTDADDFESKLEAWVSGGSAGPRHFRRL